MTEGIPPSGASGRSGLAGSRPGRAEGRPGSQWDPQRIRAGAHHQDPHPLAFDAWGGTASPPPAVPGRAPSPSLPAYIARVAGATWTDRVLVREDINGAFHRQVECERPAEGAPGDP